jgi:hypothetical protein
MEHLKYKANMKNVEETTIKKDKETRRLRDGQIEKENWNKITVCYSLFCAQERSSKQKIIWKY